MNEKINCEHVGRAVDILLARHGLHLGAVDHIEMTVDTWTGKPRTKVFLSEDSLVNVVADVSWDRCLDEDGVLEHWWHVESVAGLLIALCWREQDYGWSGADDGEDCA